MLSLLPINLLRYVALMAVQIFILSNLHISTYISPYVYPLFLLLLPFGIPRWLLLFIGFGTGLSVDLFLGSMGMHAATCVLLAYIRPFLITIITPKGTEFELEPNIYLQGTTWFFIYCSIATVFHHLCYFIIESGTFYNLFITLLRVIISATFSVLFMLLFLFLFTSTKKRRLA